jgi:hypothetical protein
MAEFKRQTFQFTNGKQIRLHGNSFFISKSLEVGEGIVPNIFSLLEEQTAGRPTASVSNLHKLTTEEIQELADYNIRLWLDLKDSIRRYGVSNPRVFNRENARLSDDGKSESPKKDGNKSGPSKEKAANKNEAPDITNAG